MKKQLGLVVMLAAVMLALYLYLVSAQSSRPSFSLGQKQEEGPFVALTFDDGPDPKYTPLLLDGLKQRGIHATFFLMGQKLEGQEELVRRIQQEGHLIGNHSYRHKALTKEGEEQVCREVEETGRLIREITGTEPIYLRPPYGAWNQELEERTGLTTVLWTVDSMDWKLRNTEQICRRVLKDTEDGDIILMHDIFPETVEAALEVVDQLQKEGCTFVTVDELLID